MTNDDRRNVAIILAYRLWCLRYSNAVFNGQGKLTALRNLLGELPTFYV